MKPGRWIWVWSALLGLGSSVGMGCATTSGSTGSDTASADAAAGGADDEPSAALKDYHRHHPRGGVVSFVTLSLETLGEEPEKAPQVEKIRTDLLAKLGPVREAEKAFVGILADGVAAGNVDTAKADAAVATLSGASGDAQAASADALNQLHALLSPAERSALTEKVQAHWEVWRQVNHTAEAGGKEAGGRLADLTQELSLTPDQVDRISTGLHASMPEVQGHFDPQQAEAHVQAFVTAFESDTFDAHTLPPMGANGHLAHHGAERMERFYAVVTPTLTADQRTQLAADLREHLNHPLAAASN